MTWFVGTRREALYRPLFAQQQALAYRQAAADLPLECAKVVGRCFAYICAGFTGSYFVVEWKVL